MMTMKKKNNDNDADGALLHRSGRSAASSWFAPRMLSIHAQCM